VIGERARPHDPPTSQHEPKPKASRVPEEHRCRMEVVTEEPGQPSRESKNDRGERHVPLGE
jgi:hypothetical protein